MDGRTDGHAEVVEQHHRHPMSTASPPPDMAAGAAADDTFHLRVPEKLLHISSEWPSALTKIACTGFMDSEHGRKRSERLRILRKWPHQWVPSR